MGKIKLISIPGPDDSSEVSYISCVDRITMKHNKRNYYLAAF